MAGNDSLTERARKAIRGTNKAAKGAPKSKRPGANNGAARQRYWAERRLEKRKIRNLVRHNGLTETQAYLHWHATRKGRVKK